MNNTKYKMHRSQPRRESYEEIQCKCLFLTYSIFLLVPACVLIPVGIIHIKGPYGCIEDTVYLNRKYCIYSNGTLAVKEYNPYIYNEGVILTSIGGSFMFIYVLLLFSLCCDCSCICLRNKK